MQASESVLHDWPAAPTPWEAARRLADLPHLLFLDSADPHPERGRYAYVMAEPVEFVTARGGERAAFARARRLLGPLRARSSPAEGPPFRGGIAGLFGYGLLHDLERIPRPHFDDLPCADLAVGRYEWVLAWDLLQHRAWVAHTPAAARRAAEIQALAAADSAPPRLTPRTRPTALIPPAALQAPSFPLMWQPGVTSTFSRVSYLKAVARAIDYVHAGDVFQVNLAQRLLAPLTEPPLEVYARLRSRNPAPFACYLDAGAFQILSASPERFLQADAAGRVSTKPIKGTRRRGSNPYEDAALYSDLEASAKDRAENVMIVDLLRNDLGRVCEYGSVQVPRICEVESYRFVHHLVSEVVGRLRPGASALDLLQAAFPGGSVTGAPKVRAMEIIAELEPTVRGPYCGSMGFIGFDGAMDTNILIRTFTAAHGWLQFPVGGGIVADSQPAAEYDETLHKAAGLLRALEV